MTVRELSYEEINQVMEQLQREESTYRGML